MAKLLIGTLTAPGRMIVEMAYNLDHPDNAGLDLESGVVITEEPEFPVPAFGKAFIWCVDPQTGESTFEEVDRPLTPEEKLQQMQAVLDTLVLDALGGGSGV
ncbi:hypothetical protein [Paenibacillus cymbidii]|uniref:hypothetical protein n=1 Tax=Paenibacillus cymbidii TaxID=1639034 RepID=UPI0010812C68|nr:hypothetical protein [Paenibacillus cymbidii]